MSITIGHIIANQTNSRPVIRTAAVIYRRMEMSWMGWVMIGAMAAGVILFAVVLIVSYLEGWRRRR